VKEPHCRSAQGWHALSRDFSVLPAHPRVYPQMGWTIPAFAFPAETGPHYRARWTNSLPRTTTWRVSQLLTVQTVTPHWAISVRPQATTLTTEPPSHPSPESHCFRCGGARRKGDVSKRGWGLMTDVSLLLFNTLSSQWILFTRHVL